MKKYLLLLLGLCALCFVCTATSHAQVDPAAPVAVAPADGPTFTQEITAFIVTQSANHPWIVTLATAIGVLRLLFKPILTGIEAYVKSTPQASDDEFIAKAEHSPAFKVFAWCLDFFGSVKIGPQFTATPQGTEPHISSL